MPHVEVDIASNAGHEGAADFGWRYGCKADVKIAQQIRLTRSVRCAKHIPSRGAPRVDEAGRSEGRALIKAVSPPLVLRARLTLCVDGNGRSGRRIVIAGLAGHAGRTLHVPHRFRVSKARLDRSARRCGGCPRPWAHKKKGTSHHSLSLRLNRGESGSTRIGMPP